MHIIESALSPEYLQTPFLNENIIESELAPLWASEIIDVDFINRILQSEIYKRLTQRKYRTVQNYANWLSIMEMFAKIVHRYETIPYKHRYDSFLLLKLQLINNFANHQGHSYWVDESFIRDINNLSKPKELPKSFPCGLLMFPSHLCPHDNFGQPVDWVLFEYVKANEAIAPFSIQQNQMETNLNRKIGESIFWATWTRNKLFTGAILASDLSNAFLTPNQQSLTKEVAAISRTIGNLLLYSLNAGANPERKLIENTKGFAKNQHKASEKEPTFLNPKWIGREVKVYHREKARGTHRSPITHQRNSYTRQQRCGKGLQEIRLVNVRATIVNKDQEDKPLTLDACLS